MIRGILIAVAAVALAGCTPMTNNPGSRETVTVTRAIPGAPAAGTATSTAAPAPARVYSGNRELSVGDQPSGGAQQSIPPGRYTVTVTSGKQAGSVIRCSSVVNCGIGSPNTLAVENALSPDYSSVIEIQPTDAAIWMQSITLTRVP